jgi:outer membrane biosynthesis protein TonB
VTKIGFDHTIASPKLTFKAVAFLSEEQFKEVQKLRGSDLVAQIIGMGAAKPAPEPEPEPEKEPETKQEAKQEPETKQENAPRRGRPPGSTNKPKDEPEQKAKEPETKPEPAPEKPKNTAASAFSMMSADLEREMAEALAQSDD